MNQKKKKKKNPVIFWMGWCGVQMSWARPETGKQDFHPNQSTPLNNEGLRLNPSIWKEVKEKNAVDG